MSLFSAPKIKECKQLKLPVLHRMSLWLIGVEDGKEDCSCGYSSQSVRLERKSTSTKHEKGAVHSHIMTMDSSFLHNFVEELSAISTY